MLHPIKTRGKRPLFAAIVGIAALLGAAFIAASPAQATHLTSISLDGGAVITVGTPSVTLTGEVDNSCFTEDSGVYYGWNMSGDGTFTPAALAPNVEEHTHFSMKVNTSGFAP